MAFTIPNKADAASRDQAGPDSVDFDIIRAGLEGDGVITGIEVTAQSPAAMAVDYAAGTFIIADSLVTIGSGSVVVTSAHASLPRFDLVVVNSAGTVSVVAGTALAPNRVFPTVPANSIALAAVDVQPGVTEITSSRIVDKRAIVKAPLLRDGSVDSTGEQAFDRGIQINDAFKVTFGTGDDAFMRYDTQNLIIRPDAVGNGYLHIDPRSFTARKTLQVGSDGVVETTAVFEVAQTTVDDTGNLIGASIFAANNTTSSNLQLRGLVVHTKSIQGGYAAQTGILNTLTLDGTQTSNAAKGIQTTIEVDAAPSSLVGYGIVINGNVAATTTTIRGFAYQSTTSSGYVATNEYGFYVFELAVGASKWPIYQAGSSGSNVFNAPTRFGSTVAATEAVDVTGNIAVSGTVDGVDIAARDHAKYTDAEAITAVEGEATLDVKVLTATSYGGITEANLVDKTAAETITALWTHALSGLPLTLQNTTDNASVEVLRLSGQRATPTDGDEIFISFQLETDSPTQAEFGRMTVIGTDVSNASKDADLLVELMRANTLTPVVRFVGSSIGIGLDAGKSITGNDNICIGQFAGDALSSGIGNICVGKDAGGAASTTSQGVYIGTNAGKVCTAATAIFIGVNAGVVNTSGNQNIFIGAEAGAACITGANNLYIGFRAGFSAISSSNVMIGTGAGVLTTTGSNNMLLGFEAGGANQTGGALTFIGSLSGHVSKADFNTAIGYRSAITISTGGFNTFIGASADAPSDGTVASSIGIGYAAKVTASNQLVIGSDDANGAITDAYIGSGVTKASPSSLTLQATGGSGTDNPGADFILGGGKGRGNAAGGNILLQTSTPGASGTTLQSLATKATVGVGAETALLVAGSFGATLTAISSNTTLDETHHTVVCDASGGAFTVTLPAASGLSGRIYHIKKIDSSGNAITVDGNASETIDGDTTKVINVQYDSMMISCDGSNWHII